MRDFHGDLLIGGLAIRHLHGTLDEGDEENVQAWSGRFEIESLQEESLEVGRQYLLLLDDGRNAEVVVTHVHAEPEQTTVVCDFEPWHVSARPR
ncbi:MAG: hypothetical protein MI725_17870 [Pirellulales bacterium]|nr:hypothetical protein [Pirellulales bacterium]